MKLFVAARFSERLGGLLVRPHLQQNQALLLLHCSAVHGFFMSYGVALVYFSAAGCVLDRVAVLLPWEVHYKRGAVAVMELLPGTPGAVQARLEQRAARIVRAVCRGAVIRPRRH